MRLLRKWSLKRCTEASYSGVAEIFSYLGLGVVCVGGMHSRRNDVLFQRHLVCDVMRVFCTSIQVELWMEGEPAHCLWEAVVLCGWIRWRGFVVRWGSTGAEVLD